MRNDGGPAFPVTADVLTDFSISDGSNRRMTGMSLRDWFAGQALAGDLDQGSRDTMDDQYWHRPAVVAARAYAIADAMLAERAK